MKKKILSALFLVILPISLLSAVWEGNGGIGSAGDFPNNQLAVRSDMFPRYTLLEITNLEKNVTAKAVVIGQSGIPGLLISISPELGKKLLIPVGKVVRVRIITPSPIQEIGDDGLSSASTPESQDLDTNPALFVASENTEPVDNIRELKNLSDEPPSVADTVKPESSKPVYIPNTMIEEDANEEIEQPENTETMLKKEALPIYESIEEEKEELPLKIEEPKEIEEAKETLPPENNLEKEEIIDSYKENIVTPTIPIEKQKPFEEEDKKKESNLQDNSFDFLKQPNEVPAIKVPENKSKKEAENNSNIKIIPNISPFLENKDENKKEDSPSLIDSIQKESKSNLPSEPVELIEKLQTPPKENESDVQEPVEIIMEPPSQPIYMEPAPEKPPFIESVQHTETPKKEEQKKVEEIKEAIKPLSKVTIENEEPVETITEIKPIKKEYVHIEEPVSIISEVKEPTSISSLKEKPVTEILPIPPKEDEELEENLDEQENITTNILEEKEIKDESITPIDNNEEETTNNNNELFKEDNTFEIEKPLDEPLIVEELPQALPQDNFEAKIIPTRQDTLPMSPTLITPYNDEPLSSTIIDNKQLLNPMLEKGKTYVQIIIHRDKDETKSIAQKYGINYPIVVDYSTFNDKQRYTVFIGPLKPEEEGAVLERFRQLGFKDAFIKRVN